MAGSVKKVLGMILAGGEGNRLYPLTQQRAKPAVPFGGKYRLIDFALSNFINSRIFSIYVLTQFKSQSLTEHLQESGPMSLSPPCRYTLKMLLPWGDPGTGKTEGHGI